MKELLFTLSLVLFLVGSSFAQFDQEPEVENDNQTIEESVDRVIINIENFVRSIDLEEFFEEDLPEFIEEVKPSPERIEEIENGLRNSVEKLKEFDSSKLDHLVDDIEHEVEEVIDEIEDVVCKRKPQKI